MPPYVKTCGGSQVASTNVSSGRRSSIAARTRSTKAGAAQPSPDRAQGLIAFDVEVVRAALRRRVPHVHLPDEAREQGSEGRFVVDALDGELDRGHRVAGRHEPVRRPLEQDASPQSRRRLPGDRAHDSVEVEPRHERPGGEVLPPRAMVVETRREGVDERDERVGGSAHGPHPARVHRTLLDRSCSRRPRLRRVPMPEVRVVTCRPWPRR
jgi:hypothetical protein